MLSLFSDLRARFRKLPQTEKVALHKSIIHSASPGLEFYLYVVLSGTIATLGLLTNSSPVIIGAMLLAPLMSPIIGIGLSTVIGDGQLLKESFLSLLRGALLAVSLAAIITLINTYLPFVSVHDLSAEIISRTRPTPIDLVIAIAGGLGGAYALSNPNMSAALPGVAIATALMPPLGVIGIGLASMQFDVALGALLLFVTNSAAIAFAAGLIFFLVGFGPEGSRYQLRRPSKRLPASMVISLIMIVLLTVPLTIFALSSFQSSSIENSVEDVVVSELMSIEGLEVVETVVAHEGELYTVEATIRISSLLSDEQVQDLHDAVLLQVEEPVRLVIEQILVTPIILD